MTRSQIIAELRRSATQDRDPWGGCAVDPFRVACDMKGPSGTLSGLSFNDLRTFYLLVAAAMEAQ